MSFEFKPTVFVQLGYETASGDWSDKTQKEIAALRLLYPELSGWGDLAFGMAWGDYSQDIYAVSWVDWLCDQRDSGFLAYIYVETLRPGFKFGGTGLYMEKIWDYGDKEPWKTDMPLPDWVQRKAG